MLGLGLDFLLLLVGHGREHLLLVEDGGVVPVQRGGAAAPVPAARQGGTDKH